MSMQAFSDEVKAMYDLNNDGENDIFYEYTEEGYYELIDYNFDGKVDQAHFFNNEGNLVSSKIDQNFDGYLETKTYYRMGSPLLTVVDIANDKLYDIYFKYEDGILMFSEKHIKPSSETNLTYVERATYEYDHAISVGRKLVDYDQSIFHNKVVTLISDVAKRRIK